MARNALGLKIFELRKLSKLTQVQLGELIGVTGVAVSQFEKGANKPSYETIEKLSGYLKYDLKPIYLEDHAAASLVNSRIIPTIDGSGGPDEIYISPGFISKPVLSIPNFIKYCLLQNPFPLSPSSFDGAIGIYGHNLPYLRNASYVDAVILEVQGNSMAPRYPDKSWHVVQPVDKDNWSHATGVHAVWLGNSKLFVRRIVANNTDSIVLSSDASGEQNTVLLSEVSALWKFGQAAHLPPED